MKVFNILLLTLIYLTIFILISVPIVLGILVNGLWWFISLITIPAAVFVSALIVSVQSIFKIND
jgi:glycosyltransferase A (GT-A) superfamily protein (DUF2064 family)